MAGTRTEQLEPADLDFALLPGQLKVIARECGLECMWAVWRAFGGTLLVIPYPKFLDETHPLPQKIGMDFALALCEAFAPRELYIAKGQEAQNAYFLGVRNQAIWHDAQRGKRYNDIARQHQLSKRQVINILNGFDAPDPNTSIFD